MYLFEKNKIPLSIPFILNAEVKKKCGYRPEQVEKFSPVTTV